MKALLVILLILNTLGTCNLKSQNLKNFKLQAHFPLTSNGEDLTGNHDPIFLDNPLFEDGGILSIGCYVFGSNSGDSCLIETPSIGALSDNSFAVQVDFKLSSFNKPIFIMGHSYRFLGLESWGVDRSLQITMNNSPDRIKVPDFYLEKDQWYNATFVHTKGDSVTQLYIDNNLVHTVKDSLIFDKNDNNFSNSNFSRGQAFFGYLKNWKVYSSNILTSKEVLDPLTDDIMIWPNPTSNQLNIEGAIAKFINYSIIDMTGKEMAHESLSSRSLDVQYLARGVYVLNLYTGKGDVRSLKFLKW